eukprot:TRINITY_DN1987_c0_g1::TRINITY_DN1987_c0_g1_i1::g.22959::m.22959 TRINITY_DN1987_c0_g1::TRINITY_DN1987_c0_g1_i1::g.22959  ORF type:complete len:236 (+),score=22.35 TRINITY_DN1987_c0_g1_i1:775-1482(+)
MIPLVVEYLPEAIATYHVFSEDPFEATEQWFMKGLSNGFGRRLIERFRQVQSLTRLEGSSSTDPSSLTDIPAKYHGYAKALSLFKMTEVTYAVRWIRQPQMYKKLYLSLATNGFDPDKYILCMVTATGQLKLVEGGSRIEPPGESLTSESVGLIAHGLSARFEQCPIPAARLSAMKEICAQLNLVVACLEICDEARRFFVFSVATRDWQASHFARLRRVCVMLDLAKGGCHLSCR